MLASPVYVEDINGTMKTWIDRMAFTCHRPAFFGKYALLVTTSGSGSTSRALYTMKNALGIWGFHVTGMRKYRMGARMKDDELEHLFSQDVQRTASILIDSIQNGKAQKPSLFSLLSFRIQQIFYRRDILAGTLDRAYWEKNGWLDRKTHYYMPVRTGRLKLLIGWLIGSAMARFFV